ncbi:MAG: VOC family protein, partial [Deltaproteobacteria bacterium]
MMCGRRSGALAALLMLAVAARAWAGRALVQTVDSVGMTVSDMDRSVRFFTDVLGFEPVSDVEVAGDDYERLEGIFGPPRGRPVPLDARSNDRSFQHVAIIVSDIDRAYRRLREHRVEHVSAGPQRLPDWNPKAGGIRAFYFKDPDGHPLEILQFPPGKGDPKWQRPTDRLFLGIDHTAIVTGDTDSSLGFYRDLLGLQVKSESENYGTEQEHLNSVFGARLRITALRARSGPGIELLEYLAPRDG